MTVPPTEQEKKKKITYADLVAELKRTQDAYKSMMVILGEMINAFNIYTKIIEVYAKNGIKMLERLEALEKRKESKESKHSPTYHT